MPPSRRIDTAVVDLDELYCMARQRDGFSDLNIWKTARRGAAALAESFYASGLGAVVVEGGFLSESEYSELTQHVVSDAQETFVTLLVSPAEALRRAQEDPDPGRVVSRHPEVQKILYAEFRSALPFLTTSSIVLPADEATPEELARSISEIVLAGVEEVGS